MATGAELMQRPLPEANVPPDMAPREPPEQLGGAPTVTAVEQVIPAHAGAGDCGQVEAAADALLAGGGEPGAT